MADFKKGSIGGSVCVKTPAIPFDSKTPTIAVDHFHSFPKIQNPIHPNSFDCCLD
jgi:hypothetical protein